jgi:hypothetical protein
MPLIDPGRRSSEERRTEEETIDRLINGKPPDPYEAFREDANEPTSDPEKDNDPATLAEEVPRT